jgi:hypothetical protein
MYSSSIYFSFQYILNSMPSQNIMRVYINFMVAHYSFLNFLNNLSFQFNLLFIEIFIVHYYYIKHFLFILYFLPSTHLDLLCSALRFFFMYHFYIYSYVYTLFGPPPPPPASGTEAVQPSCSPILLRRKHKS